MGTVLVDYFDAECMRCGWKHRLMVGGGMGSIHAHDAALKRHEAVTYGRCSARTDEITEQQIVAVRP
jgi:hypothetical protein